MRRVVVTGMGVISPVGNNSQAFWRSLCSGVCGIERIRNFDASAFDSQIAGEVKDFNPQDYGISQKQAKRLPKFVQYAISAAKEAIQTSNLDLEKEDRNRIGVLVGAGIGNLQVVEDEHSVLLEKGPSRVSPFLIPKLIGNEASGFVAITFRLKGPNLCITTACASGGHSVGIACRTIQYGEVDIMLAGGTESCITPLSVAGFCSLKALSCRNNDPKKASRPFDGQRDGFVMAEGCGIVVLEELEHARKRGAPIIAEIKGFGMSADAYHSTAPDPEGEGAAQAMQAALKDAQINPQEVDYINAHGTSTKLNDKIETLAIKKVFGEQAKKLMVSSTKSMTGHLLGAAGAVEFIVSCLSIKDGLVPPTINYEFPDPECDLDYVPNSARHIAIKTVMSNSLGFGGHNACLIVKCPTQLPRKYY